jgi:calcium-dependent protein kinase
MHGKGYVHRDMKPENISLERRDDFRSLKISSFLTVKKKEEEQTLISGINGSYLYMAPEMIMGDMYDEKVDVWSLGIILYMLVALRHPIGVFDNEISRLNLKNKLIEKFKFVPRDELIDFQTEEFFKYSVAVPELVKKMLEVNPSKRLTPKEVMNNKWINENYQQYKKKASTDFQKGNTF